ncbi:MAG: hypothetical protein WD895_02745 [Acidimicrobiia bacterium]
MTDRSVRRHLHWYRRLVAVTPPAHRLRFGDDQVTLFGDLLASGEAPTRLWFRAAFDLFTVFGQYKEAMVNHSARISLAVISLAPLLVAAMLLWSMIEELGDVPNWLALIALGLILQGGYTLVWLSGRLQRWQRWASGLFAAGETTALVAGAMATFGVLSAFDDSDPEYAPLMVAVVVAIHGLVGLLAVFTSKEETPIQA